MIKQPRDKNGRFVGKKEKTNILYVAIPVLLIMLLFGMVMAETSGYNRGYQTGLSDNQPTIYQNGFNAGTVQQKNIDELARNWTVCSPQTRIYVWERTAYCRNDDPDRVAFVDSNYKTTGEYTVFNVSKYYGGCYR